MAYLLQWKSLAIGFTTRRKKKYFLSEEKF